MAGYRSDGFLLIRMSQYRSTTDLASPNGQLLGADAGRTYVKQEPHVDDLWDR